MTNVTVSVEAARGCGYRKPGKSGVGVYLCGDGLSAPCGLLPLPLEVCACCGGGIKANRGWTWITPQRLCKPDVLSAIAGTERNCERTVGGIRKRPPNLCGTCPVGTPPPGLHGLLWVGEKFYSVDEYEAEARRMGVSRKIKTVPKGFVLGETWVYLAHRHAARDAQGARTLPGIFTAFRPTRVDLVIADEHNVPPLAESLAERIGDGARIVRVIPETAAQQRMFADSQEAVAP